MRAYALLLSALGMVVLAAGCGSFSDPFLDGKRDPRVVGTWTQTAMAIGSQSTACPGSITYEGYALTCIAQTWVFRADGTCQKGPVDGKWVLQGDKLRVEFSVYFPFEWTAAFSADGRTMTLAEDMYLVHEPYTALTEVQTLVKSGG